MIKAEVAVYPLKTNNASGVINNSIDSLNNHNINYRVGSTHTEITGSTDDVFNSLQTMFSEAERIGGEINMVVTISNASE